MILKKCKNGSRLIFLVLHGEGPEGIGEGEVGWALHTTDTATACYPVVKTDLDLHRSIWAFCRLNLYFGHRPTQVSLQVGPVISSLISNKALWA